LRPLRPGRRVEWRLPQKRLSTALVDIDVHFTEVVFRRRAAALGASDDPRPASFDYAIEGVVLRSAAQRDSEDDPERRLVYLYGYRQSERTDRDGDRDPRSICYIANDRREDFAYFANIYIEGRIFRRMVELYATKRIDCARISIVATVLSDSSGAVEAPTLTFPALRTVGDSHREFNRCRLLSVQTSLRFGPRGGGAIGGRTAARGPHAGRPEVAAPRR
jgi:hypothetical protein